MFSVDYDKVILFLFINVYFTIATEDGKEQSVDSTHGTSMWFGPRLGKRSSHMQPENDRALYRMLEAADVLKYYYDQLPDENQQQEPRTRVTKKVVFKPILGRSLEEGYNEKTLRDVDFTPRLGRRFVQDFGVTVADQDEYRYDPFEARAKLFSPRLGRSRTFSPRLGRDISYESYPRNIREARSVNNTEANV